MLGFVFLLGAGLNDYLSVLRPILSRNSDSRVHLQGANKVTLSCLFDPISFGAVDAPRFVRVYEMARVLGKDRDLFITTGWNGDALSVPS